MRHFGKGVDRLNHAFPISLRHAHRSQHKRAAHALNLKHRTETGQHTRIEQALQTGDQILLTDPERCGGFGVGAFTDRKVALQTVDDRAIDRVNQRRLTHSGRRSA